jgi:hypothetical protein
VISPLSAAGASDAGASEPGAADGAALGAVVAAGDPQAAAMIAIPATIDASRSCFFIVLVVSSLEPGGCPPGPTTAVGSMPTGLAGVPGL